MNILLVEDNDLQLKLITEFLRETEFKVIPAKNAFEAWQAANQEMPDLILLDIMMPGMSGIELCKKFKASKKLSEIPVIFLTALGNKNDIIVGLKSGAADYIAKPFDQQELLARINVHLELKKSKDTILEQNNKLKLELERRRIAEENFRIFFQAVSASPAMVVITDKNGIIEYVNPAFTDITGYKIDEVQGKKPNIIKSGYHSEGFYKNLWETILSGAEWQGEFCNKKRNGDLYWEFASIAPLKNDEQEFSHIVAVKVDVTESKKSMERIKKYNEELKELNATKDKFFSIIAHDLKNPLSVLMTSTEIMANPEYELSSAEFIDFSQEIHKSSKRLYSLLENLLTWARSQTGRIEYTPDYSVILDVAQSAAGLLGHNASAKNISLNLNIPNNTVAYCDYNMASAVFRNLISNAIKFTPNNGSVNVNFDKMLTSPKNGLKYLQFSISDTGVGISDAFKANMFKIDKTQSTLGTAKEKGTGLGLIICKEFIDKHTGDLWVESVEGKGTTFRFTLPLSENKLG
jgi:PAS domain S-box-containing protein